MNPQPNEHGVYDKADAESIRFESGDIAYAEVSVLEIEPGKWATGYGCHVHESGYGGPITKRDGLYDSAGIAFESRVQILIEYLQAHCADWKPARTIAEANDLLRQINEYRNQGRLF